MNTRELGESPEAGRYRRPPGWSVTGELQLQSSTVDPTGKSVTLQVDFGLTEARYYTIQFSLKNPSPPFDPATDSGICLRAKATITWTVAGNSTTRIVSVSDGSSISGLGNSVNIQIEDASDNVSGVENKTYTVSASVSSGSRPTLGGTQPPLYTPREELETTGVNAPPYPVAAASNVDIPVPENSGANAVFIAIAATDPATVFTGNDVSITQQGFSGPSLFRGNYDCCNKWIPIAPGALVVTVANNTADIIEVTPLFGIEG